MNEKEKEGFERMIEKAELEVDEIIAKEASKEVSEYNKEHLYHGTKKRKHIVPKGK